MKEIFVNLFKDTKERVSSPFFSSFIFSWSVWNWKIILSLFQESDRIAYISDYLKDEEISICTKLIYPLGAALLYTGLNPFLKRSYDWLNAVGSSWLSDKINLLRKKTIDLDKYDKLVEDKRELKEKYDKLFDNNEILQNKIIELKKEKDEIEKNLNSKTTEFNHLSKTTAGISKELNELKEIQKNKNVNELIKTHNNNSNMGSHVNDFKTFSNNNKIEEEIDEYLKNILSDNLKIKAVYNVFRHVLGDFNGYDLKNDDLKLFKYFINEFKVREFLVKHRGTNEYLFSEKGEKLKLKFLNSVEFKKFNDDEYENLKEIPF